MPGFVWRTGQLYQTEAEMKTIFDILSPRESLFRKGREPEEKTQPAPLPLDVIGQRSEGLRHRMDAFCSRLEDTVLLREEFQILLKPLSDIATELELARTRINELEQGLRIEQRSRDEACQTVLDLKTRYATFDLNISEMARKHDAVAAELSQKTLQAEKLEEALLLAEESQAEAMRRASEYEKALKIHDRENTVNRAALEASAARIAQLENELNVASEKTEMLGRECQRLRENNAVHAQQLTESAALQKTLEIDLAGLRKRLADAEAQLAQEQAGREQAHVQHRSVLATLQAEKVASEEQNTSLRARLDIAEQSTRQLRQQLLERDEAYRTLERHLHDVQMAKSLAENAHQALQAEATKLAERAGEAEKARREADNRSAMMAKAIAAKDAILDQNGERISALTAMLADAETAIQAEKTELQATIRRLTAEIENEKSERALLQGALNISRESRAEVQRQFDSFRRTARLSVVGQEASPPDTVESNVLSINQKG